MISPADIPLSILDFFWKPKWKKEALGILKGGQKFLHYKRDLLEADRIAEIGSRIKDLKAAISKRDRTEVTEAEKQLIGTCEHSLRGYRSPGPLAENLEVFFVAIAVALGIRAYYIQPFRIPTGSMQPTLNGIVGHPIPNNKEWNKPNIITQGFHKITEGRTYIQIVAKSDTEIVGVHEKRQMWFFTKTVISYADGSKQTYSGSKNSIINGLELGKNMKFYTNGVHYDFFDPQIVRAQGQRPRRFPVKKGQVLAQGWVDTGDLVLVDKFSYNFRKPKRGEVFVFETRGIENIQSEARLKDQEAGSHYIKRLAGVPGDTLRIEAPNLWHNGKLAAEKGFHKVASRKDDYTGYVFPGGPNARYLRNEHETLTLEEDKYFALGDNSPNSSDSRYWGDIDEYLLIGPGLFTLWPFENFGAIR